MALKSSSDSGEKSQHLSFFCLVCMPSESEEQNISKKAIVNEVQLE